MQAIVQDRYGSADVLKLQEVAKPAIGVGDVLIRVHAASVHIGDWHVMTGLPYVIRPLVPDLGLRAPKTRVRGMDVAGTVEAIGQNVTRFQVGDEVFGTAEGSFAEYTRAREDRLAHKPANLTFQQAAAVPTSATSALQALRDVGEIQTGQKVLIIGASGGVGMFAVQIAKAFGAEVTGVSSTAKTELVRSLGADHVVDYTREDFAHGSRRYDVLFDLVGNRSLGEYRRALTPTGTLILAGGGVSGSRPRLVGPMGLTLGGMVRSRFVRPRVLTLTDVPRSGEILAALRELVEAGKVVPVIDQTYSLVEAPAAIRYVEVEHARAKVVITV